MLQMGKEDRIDIIVNDSDKKKYLACSLMVEDLQERLSNVVDQSYKSKVLRLSGIRDGITPLLSLLLLTPL